MIPKVIHLCWFSNDPFPVEIKVCIDTWKRLLPDYKIRRWTYEDAIAINIPFINEALGEKKWAFAADVVRFYALYKEGGVYMDSDIYLKRRFDEFIPESGFATFNELTYENDTRYGLQAAFMIGAQGNLYCRGMLDYYKDRHFKKYDGTYDKTVSPVIMSKIAEQFDYVHKDIVQQYKEIIVYPARFLSPRKKFNHSPKAIGIHRIYGSWRKRKFGRRVEIAVKHYFHVVKYAIIGR